MVKVIDDGDNDHAADDDDNADDADADDNENDADDGHFHDLFLIICRNFNFALQILSPFVQRGLFFLIFFFIHKLLRMELFKCHSRSMRRRKCYYDSKTPVY